jgi:5'(3')-deoxyribonucleotidase
MDRKEFILGVDLDGVVGDFYGAMREICAEWLGRDVAELTPQVSFGLEEWEIGEFGGYDRLHRFAVTQKDIYRTMRPIHEAPAVLRKLSAQGIRIRIITHRLFLKYSHKTSITQTVEWLDKHDVPYWDLCFMNDKGAVGANLYIDDAPQNVTALRKMGARTIVFSNSTNHDVAGPRADTWQDVFRMVLDAREEWRTGTQNIFEV